MGKMILARCSYKNNLMQALIILKIAAVSLALFNSFYGIANEEH